MPSSVLYLLQCYPQRPSWEDECVIILTEEYMAVVCRHCLINRTWHNGCFQVQHQWYLCPTVPARGQEGSYCRGKAAGPGISSRMGTVSGNSCMGATALRVVATAPWMEVMSARMEGMSAWMVAASPYSGHIPVGSGHVSTDSSHIPMQGGTGKGYEPP